MSPLWLIFISRWSASVWSDEILVMRVYMGVCFLCELTELALKLEIRCEQTVTYNHVHFLPVFSTPGLP